LGIGNVAAKIEKAKKIVKAWGRFHDAEVVHQQRLGQNHQTDGKE